LAAFAIAISVMIDVPFAHLDLIVAGITKTERAALIAPLSVFDPMPAAKWACAVY